ncbi:MAG TPA: VWA domain-containing protein [Candidatus Acidoferrum sp.]|nr:VWA domain-containing protein [Candidatus Acidoferrum sp.]
MPLSSPVRLHHWVEMAVFLMLFSTSIRALGANGSRAKPGCGHAAAEQTSGHVLRSEVNLQTVNVQVKDKSGKDVRGLTVNDFTVRENGQRQKIAFFDPGTGPVTIAVLVDSSVSVSENGKVGSAEQIAAQFMRVARPGDDIFAMDFTDSTGPFEHLTAEQLRNPGPVAVPSAGGSGSALYDAIATAICYLRESKNPRQAIIVITDGVDEHSRLTLDQSIALVRSQRAQLFMIGLHSRPEFRFEGRVEPKIRLVTGQDIDNPGLVFYRLTKEAGAETFTANSQHGLRGGLKAVSDMLDSEYTLAYYPPSTSRKTRKIDVKLDRHGLRVLGNRVAVSTQTLDETAHYLSGTCSVSPTFYARAYESRTAHTPGGNIYRDDFSDPHSGWPVHSDSHYVPGGYELSTVDQVGSGNYGGGSASKILPAGGGPQAISSTIQGPTRSYRENVIAAYGPGWPDFRVSATVKALKPPSDWNEEAKFSHPVRAAAGLAFRIDLKGYYALLVSPSVQNRRMLAFELVARTFHGDSYAELTIVPWTTIPQDSPVESRLAIEDVGDQIRIFVDGKLVGIARDETFEGGYEGFVVSAPAAAVFSNFVLEQK